MIKLSIKNSMATGKEEFHTINDYLYLGCTGARTPISGTYSEAEEKPEISDNSQIYGLSIRNRRVSYWVTNNILHFLIHDCVPLDTNVTAGISQLSN